MKLQDLAYKLAAEHGYKYTRTNEFTILSYSDRIKIGCLIMFILEQEN
jgi:hypothetical protein